MLDWPAKMKTRTVVSSSACSGDRATKTSNNVINVCFHANRVHLMIERFLLEYVIVYRPAFCRQIVKLRMLAKLTQPRYGTSNQTRAIAFFKVGWDQLASSAGPPAGYVEE